MRYLFLFLVFVTSAFTNQRLYVGTDFYYQDFKEKFFSKLTGKEKIAKDVS